MTELHSGALRALAREAAHATRAMEAHRAQLRALATARRDTVRRMVELARVAKVASPQAHVARLLGVSQQTVSKIMRGE